MVIAAAPVGGAAARRAARAELAKAEYRRDRPSLLTRVLHWLSRRLDSVLAGAGAGHAVLLVIVVLVVVALVFAVRAGAPSRRAQHEAGSLIDPLAPTAARDHRGAALGLSAQGHRREALREWLRAAVQAIEERGVLPPRPGRTGAATAREAGPLLPSAAADLAAAMTAFDEVWFGGRSATDDDVARARAAADGAAAARITAPAAVQDIAAPW